MFELGAVTKSHGQRRVLGPVDLALGAERRLALVGPSGSGKSTVLRLLVGLIAPDSGRVEVFGEPVTPASVTALRLRLGYMIQEGALFPHLTASDNVALVARELGWSAERRRARCEELGQLVRLPAATLGRFPAELSGGERQRVALMRALFLDPELLLLDEPLGAVDPWNRRALEGDLLRIVTELRKGVLLVTHDLDQAAYLTDEIAVLRHGLVEQRGSYDALRSAPASQFVSDFVGAGTSPP